MISRIPRRRFAAVLAAAFAALAAPVWAQTPSDKPLRIIAAGPPGGSLDIVARLLGDGLQKEFKQTVIVETKPGAGGAIAVNDLMQAPHDGNTVLVSLDGMVSEIPHIVKLKFNMAKGAGADVNFRRAVALEPLVGDRGARNVAAQALEFLALMFPAAHPGMQAEAVRIGAQGRRVFFVPTGHRSQAQHLLSGARPQRDAIAAGGGLQ